MTFESSPTLILPSPLPFLLSPTDHHPPTMDESEVRANDLAGMISEAEDNDDEGGDLFGGSDDDENDGDVKMDGDEEEGKQESTGSVGEGGASPGVQQ